MPEEREILSPTEATQASRRRANFRVLIISLLLAAVAGMILYAYFYAHTPAPM